MADYDPQIGRTMRDDPDPDLASDELEADRHGLENGLRQLAGTVSGALSLTELLSQVAAFATHAIPGVDGACVTLLRAVDGPSRIASWAATSDVVREIDRIQYELLDEGPCLTCMQTGRTVISGSLGRDERWPRFGGRVARLGVHSALSLPLLVEKRVVGAINTYARERDVFTEHSVRLGEQFAGPAAVAVHNAQLLAAASTRAEQLQSALTSRTIIDQAIGIVRSRSGGTAEEAFDRLRQVSQTENVKLATVAQRLVDEAVRRAQARHSDR